jgi:hypothetical protein
MGFECGRKQVVFEDGLTNVKLRIRGCIREFFA